MTTTPLCQTCGARPAVGTVMVHEGGQEDAVHMCAQCKQERLDRRRVRVGRHRRQPGRMTRLGYVLIALGLAALLLLGGARLLDSFGDKKPAECYPGAGFSCPP